MLQLGPKISDICLPAVNRDIESQHDRQHPKERDGGLGWVLEALELHPVHPVLLEQDEGTRPVITTNPDESVTEGLRALLCLEAADDRVLMLAHHRILRRGASRCGRGRGRGRGRGGGGGRGRGRGRGGGRGGGRGRGCVCLSRSR